MAELLESFDDVMMISIRFFWCVSSGLKISRDQMAEKTRNSSASEDVSYFFSNHDLIAYRYSRNIQSDFDDE